MAAWEQGGEAVGGLATDFVAMAAGATWSDDVLEVTFPADATTAVAFLARPETAAALNRELSAAAGRPVRHRIIQQPKARPPAARAIPGGETPVSDDQSGGMAAPAPRSQATLLRETMDHPLVAHARGLFDAAIRKVEPGRARPAVAAISDRGVAEPAGETLALPEDADPD
jgi:hypothetical protein